MAFPHTRVLYCSGSGNASLDKLPKDSRRSDRIGANPALVLAPFPDDRG
jgi:hypothetical protein